MTAVLPTFLVLPHRLDLAPLARAWFPEAEWVQAPAADAAPVGARFRGIAGPRSVAGRLRLTWTSHLEGPLDHAELEGFDVGQVGAVHRLRTEDPAPDGRVLEWLRAVARRVGGAVVEAGRPAERFDADSVVDLAVYSPVPVPPEVMLGLLRAVVPAATLTDAPDPSEGIAPYTIHLPTAFDGSVEMHFSRADEIPLSLLQLDWREYGPFSYRVTWRSPSEEASWQRVARARVRPVVARVAFAVQRAAEGSVVDGDGFQVPHEELVKRAVAG